MARAFTHDATANAGSDGISLLRLRVNLQYSRDGANRTRANLSRRDYLQKRQMLTVTNRNYSIILCPVIESRKCPIAASPIIVYFA